MEEVLVSGAVEATKLQKSVHQWIGKLTLLPGLNKLRPAARVVARVAELPGRLDLHAAPEIGQTHSAGRALTVISANLWHDWPQHRRAQERLETFAQMVEAHHADVLLLQEVARTADFSVDRWLAERLGMGFVYSRANGHRQGIGFEEGVAIFSRFPLKQPVLRQLSPAGNPFVHRLALGTQIETPFGEFGVFSVHLGINGKQNARQVEQLHRWVGEISGSSPAVVGGDFNAGEFSKSIQRLKKSWMDTFRHLNPFADGTTHEIRWPWGKTLKRSRLDYIFLKAEEKKWQVLEALHLEVPGQPHSDHRAVLLRLAPAFAPVRIGGD